MVRVAVVGHVEWMEFAVVEHLPSAGEVVHGQEAFEDAGGSGAVAAVQLARLAGAASFLTALAGDERGRRSRERLAELGVDVHAAGREGPQRHGWVHLDHDGERTITVIGERIVPHGSDPLPWDALDGLDGVYFTGGDAAALRAARRAKVLVATPRAAATLREAGVGLDALVRSGKDPGEQLDPASLDPEPALVVSTEGAEGGRWQAREGRTGSWHAAPLPGPRMDAYGAGDSFAAGLTYGLAAGMQPADALQLAARCGAANMTGRGPYAGQLTAADL